MEGFLDYITTVSAREANGRLKPVYGIVPDLSAGRDRSRRRCRAIAASARCASAIAPSSRTSTTAMAASSWRRRRCSSTSACRGRATSRCSSGWSGSARRRQALAFEPDAGLWEFRDRSRIHTSFGCAVLGGLRPPGQDRHGRSASTPCRCLARHRPRTLRNASSKAPGTLIGTVSLPRSAARDLDASLLLLQEVGIVAANDPRFVSHRGRHRARTSDAGISCSATPTKTISACRPPRSTLHLLVHRCAGGHRPRGRGARTVPGDAVAAQSCRPAVGGSRSRHAANCGAISRRPIPWSA